MKIINSFSKLGPGLLYAGAAIGVSHLVQSTKAGALYGCLFLIFVPIIHLIKFPFFNSSNYYFSLTGKNILHGFREQGKVALLVYILLTVLSMGIILSAVALVTGSVLSFLCIPLVDIVPVLKGFLNVKGSFNLVLLFCSSIILLGGYKYLERYVKFMVIFLSITTLIVTVVSLLSYDWSRFHLPIEVPSFSYSSLVFLASFLGWMPAPIDVVVWQSVWIADSNKSDGEITSKSDRRFDFLVGFLGTALVATFFIIMGAFVMFSKGVALSPKGAVFTKQFISAYVDTIGIWSFYVVGLSAFVTMLSTTITCLDAMPRTLAKALALTAKDEYSERKVNKIYRFLVILLSALTYLIVTYYAKNMGLMVKTATIMSFITAPVIGFYLLCSVKKAEKVNNVSSSASINIYRSTCLIILSLLSLSYVVISLHSYF